MAIKNKAGEWINIQNARVHNLDHVNVDIPRDHLIVITGLSGSGKSSLAFDTLYAEGQRRYVESLSSYARQFLDRMDKPEVKSITGIPPAIAIDQNNPVRTSRSTVGTMSELNDYFKLLFARAAHLYCPDDFLKSLKQQGFRNFMCHDAFYRVDDRAFPPDVYEEERLDIVIDRLKVKEGDDAFLSRLSDSVETAFNESGGECLLWVEGGERKEKFNHRFEADGMEFEQPTEQMFSFNSPLGACPVCEGYGKVLGIDEDLVVPDKTRSVYDDAVACWRGEKTGKWKKSVVMNAGKVDFPVHRPYNQLNEEQKEMLWNGSGAFKGINHFFQHLEKKKYKIQNRVMIARYRGKSTCPECKGKRLRKEAGYVKINQTAIQDLLDLPVDQLHDFFLKIRLSDYEVKIGQRILVEINNRIQFLLNVGLGYLTLNRMSSTLSGGESQRINLASSLGSNLVGSLYVLDEPSVGLHPRDTSRLVEVLKQLREKGNTVVVVEHEEEIIRAADYIIDMGPEAGRLGGKVVYQGTGKGLLKHEGLTAEYLNGTRSIPVPDIRRKASQFIKLEGVREHNLKNINVEFPLG
ncbi:MAG: AAA family ATPase, partial [Bacteroidota bacterium]